MSNDPDDDGPTCPLCGEYVRWGWPLSVGLVCDHCEDEAERLEAQAADQPDINEDEAHAPQAF